MTQRGSSIASLLDAMSIQYLAPADAAHLRLPSKCVDYHISYTVLEHICPEILIELLLEGKRVLKEEGLFIHCIDFSDHFSHSDRSISSINFLQFSEYKWKKYAGNRYMYHNRLRIDEFIALFNKIDLKVISLETRVNPVVKEELSKGLMCLDERFRDKPIEVNATANAWVVARLNSAR